VNEKILKKMKKAGINWLCYGIESASEHVREGMTKGRFGEGAIRKAVAMTHDAGINVLGNFMFGLPRDDFDTMRLTLDLAKSLRCEFVNFYMTMAYPGSRLYDDALKKGVSLPKTWLDYSQFSEEVLPLPTDRLSSEDVMRFRDMAFEEYFSDPEYLSMIREKFGEETANHIKEMLKIKIRRRPVDNKPANKMAIL
jgi:radical SAM superfamily enzyme YgiQ (UPF0313 family)